MRNFLSLLLILFSLNSCIQRQITGTYIGNLKFATEKIVLTNNRFTYDFREHMSHYQSRGVWYLSRNKIYFTSDSDITEMNGRVKEELDPNLKINRLQFFNVLCNSPWIDFPVTLNDSITIHVDSLGRIETNFEVSKFYTKFLPGYYFFYKRKDKKANSFIICLDPADRSALYFNKEQLKLKKNFIVDQEGNKLKKK